MNMFTCKEPSFIMGDAVCLLVITRIVSNGKIGCKDFIYQHHDPLWLLMHFGNVCLLC